MGRNRYSGLLMGAFGIAAVAASPAMAADTPWYVGGSLGYVSTSVDTGVIDAAVRASGAARSTTTADDSDTGWKLFFGYQFNEKFALEAHYTDLGSISTSTTTTGPVGTVSGDYDFKAWGIDAVGFMPVSKQIDLFGKIGIYRADTDARAAAVVGGATSTVGVSGDNTGVKFGLGGRYHFTGNLALRLEWEHFNDVGNSDTTGNGSFNFFTLGMQFRF